MWFHILVAWLLSLLLLLHLPFSLEYKPIDEETLYRLSLRLLSKFIFNRKYTLPWSAGNINWVSSSFVKHIFFCSLHLLVPFNWCVYFFSFFPLLKSIYCRMFLVLFLAIQITEFFPMIMETFLDWISSFSMGVIFIIPPLIRWIDYCMHYNCYFGTVR